MKRPGFLEGVGVAIIASVAGGALFTLFATFFAGGLVLRVLIAALGLFYVLYLLRRSAERVGRLTTVAVWFAAALGIWLAGLTLPLYLLAHLALVWLVRALYFYSSLFSAVADLALVLFGVAAGVWAWLETGSLSISLWSFFLVQALFALVPGTFKRRPAERAATDRFQHAYRVAEAAVTQLSSVR